MPKTDSSNVAISPPQMAWVTLPIVGTAPLCVHRFSSKAQAEIEATQEAGSAAKTKKVREPRQFEQDFENAKYVAEDGWLGMNAAAFRNAMISACKAAGFVMTRAKLAVFIEPDGLDKIDGTPLVRIYGDEPMLWKAMARNSNGSFDVRVRPRWNKWKAKINVRYDKGIFKESDVVNLMLRVGMQVGIGEGRPDSKSGPGIGLGMFKVVNAEEF